MAAGITKHLWTLMIYFLLPRVYKPAVRLSSQRSYLTFTLEHSIIKTVGQIAGIGGIALGVLLLIFRDVIRKNIFPALTKEQAYRLIRLIVFLTFMIAVLGMIAWIYVSKLGIDRLTRLVPESNEVPVTNLPGPYVSGGDRELEVTDISYDQNNQLLDVKVRNNSQQSTVVEGIKIYFHYSYYIGAELHPSGKLDARIKRQEIDKAKEAKMPLSIEKAFAVSYVIPPKGADRYLFNIALQKDDLYYPQSRYGGEYELWVTFHYNKDKESGEMVTLSQLLKGSFDTQSPNPP